MEHFDVLRFVGGQLLTVLPSVVAWTVAVVVAALLKARGGGRPVTFLVIGASLMLAAVLLRIPLAALPPLLIARDWAVTGAAVAASFVRTGIGIVELAGIVCLVYAFWLQFHVVDTLRQSSKGAA